MSDAPSKYALNQFLSATRDSFPLMSEVLADALTRITFAEGVNPAFADAQTAISNAKTAWSNGETALANAGAAQLSASAVLDDKMASLTRKPDMANNSPIESWDLTIRAVAPVGSALYILLLPHGRETLTAGTIDERIDAIKDLGVRLAAQGGQATLTALASGHVTPFATTARTQRTTQDAAMMEHEGLRTAQEALRVSAAAALYAMVGQGMIVFQDTPGMVDSLFDVNLLRAPSQTVPAAPADTAWHFPSRTLSTTALPLGATRLEAWRLGGGGAAERLAVGETDELTVSIPAMYTFDSGEAYDLWLVARNSKGSSGPGPVIVFTAP